MGIFSVFTYMVSTLELVIYCSLIVSYMLFLYKTIESTTVPGIQEIIAKTVYGAKYFMYN